MATTDMKIRIDNEVKERAQKIFASLGFDMTTAVNIFLQQTVRQNDIPFVVTTKIKPAESGGNVSSRKGMFGCLAGQIWMADDFDAPLDDFAEYME